MDYLKLFFYIKISPIERQSILYNEVQILKFKFVLPIINHFPITQNDYLTLKEKHRFPMFFKIDIHREEIFKTLNMEEYCI